LSETEEIVPKIGETANMASREGKTLTTERIRKERALASLRELQLAEAEGKLLRADQVEQAWAGAVIKLRNAVLAIPSRCAAQFSDPRNSE
jgi:phage terminase Nu1 subunit (DNA packaging protein)